MDALTLQMLRWLDEKARSYDETMDAWKTSCPRLSIWEDAERAALVKLENGAIVLTALGKEALGIGREGKP